MRVQVYRPFAMRDGTLVSDLPHERELIDVQLGKRSAVSGALPMDGFVEALLRLHEDQHDQPS
jgi:hypothetical protein